MGEKQQSKINLKNDNFFVEFSSEFNYFYTEIYSEEKLNLIDDFIDHFEENGLKGWKGKIARSENVPDSYYDADERKKLAKEYNLYHAHIGLPSWESTNERYKTSNQVLHFQKVSYNEIKLLSISNHNPIDLPTIENILDEDD